MAELNFDEVLRKWKEALGATALETVKPSQTLRPRTNPATPDQTVAQTSAPGQEEEEEKAKSTFIPPQNVTLSQWNEYTIQDLVGEGGMGQIYRADQGALRRDVAIKKIIPEPHSEEADAKREAFVSEALVTGFLDHPNIVPVYALGQDTDGKWFFSMKLVRGISWKNLLHPGEIDDPVKRAQALERNLDIDEPQRSAEHLEANLRILLSVCNAIAFAHSKNIIHRDLKPENVMVGAFGEVLVMDWGLAVEVSESAPAEASQRVPHRSDPRVGVGGTPAYMAPEQTMSDGSRLGIRTDVFLLGSMLYELLTGTPPNSGDSINVALAKAFQCSHAPMPDSAPQEIRDICNKALAKEPAQRHASTVEFQQAIEGFFKHKESAQIAARGEQEAKGGEIRNLARAVVLYEQAIAMWPENLPAKLGSEYAQTTLARKERVARTVRRAAASLAATIFLIVTVAFFWIRTEQQATSQERDEKDRQRELAVAEASRADQNAEEERRERQRAERQERSAKERLADALVAEARTYIRESKWEEAKSRYSEALSVCGELKLSTLPIDAGLMEIYDQSPPPLMDGLRLPAPATALAPLPDGRTVLAGTGTGGIFELDLWTGAVRGQFQAHNGAVIEIRVRADSSEILTVGSDQSIKRWAWPSKQPLAEFKNEHKAPVLAVEYVPSPDRVVSLDANGAFRIWSLETGECTLRKTLYSIGCATFNLKQSELAVTKGGKVFVIHLLNSEKSGNSWYEEQEMYSPQDKPIGTGAPSELRFSSDGSFLLGCGAEKDVLIWNVAKHEITGKIHGHNDLVLQASYSPDDRWIVTGGRDRTLRLWDATTLRQMACHTNFVKGPSGILFLPNSQHFVTATPTGEANVWRVGKEEGIRVLPGHSKWCHYVALSPDGKLVAASGDRGSVQIWDLATGRKLSDLTILGQENAVIGALAFFDHGRQIACIGDAGGKLRTYEVVSGKSLTTMTLSFSSIFSRDGESVISVLNDGNLVVTGTNSGERLSKCGVTGDTSALDLSWDGRFVASAQVKGSMPVCFELSKPPRAVTLEERPGQFSSLIFLPNSGGLMGIASRDRLVFWDPETGKVLRELPCPNHQMTNPSVSADGHTLVWTSESDLTGLHDLERGREIYSLTLPVGGNGNAVISADGRRMIVGGQGSNVVVLELGRPGQLREWNARLPELRAILHEHPDDPSALSELGSYFAFRGEGDWAYALLKVPRQDGSFAYPEILANVCERIGNLKGALQALDAEHKLLGIPDTYLDLRSSKLRSVAPDEYLAQAQASRVNKAYAQALERVSDSLEFRGDNPAAFSERARIYLEARDLVKSETDARESLRLDPKHAGGFIVLGDLTALNGNWATARDFYDHAAEVDMDNLEALDKRATANEKLEKWDGVIWDCTRLIELQPKNPAPYLRRANAQLWRKDLAAAILDYTRAIPLTEDPKNLYLERGNLRRRKQDWRAAIEDYTWVLDRESRNAAALIGRARCYLGLKDYEAALVDAKLAGTREAVVVHAMALNASGNSSDALQELNHIIGSKAEDEEALYQRALVFEKLGKLLEACDDLDRLIALFPKAVGYIYKRGLLRFDLKQWPSAIEDMARTIELNPQANLAYLKRALAREQTKDLPGAREDLARSLEINAENYEAWFHRGRLSEDLERSVECLSKALKLAPTHAASYYQRGFCLRKLGRFEEAIADLSRCLDLDPKHIVAYWQRGLCRSDLGDKARAIEDFNRYLELDPKNPHALQARGLAYYSSDKSAEALEDFKAAAESAEATYITFAYLTLIYCESQKWLEAEQALEELRKRDPIQRDENYITATYYAYRSDSHSGPTGAGAREADRKLALDNLEKALDAGFDIKSVKQAPQWDSFKEDGHFLDLIKRFSLPKKLKD